MALHFLETIEVFGIQNGQLNKYSKGGAGRGGMPTLRKRFYHYLRSCLILFGIHFSVKETRLSINIILK